ncbi:MAG: hypothetical protein DMD80_13115 [Candidatus Rokuibacteriota bacterium]|nr:MAG: hypothetical protein DMD80_13115 [Candidatus Rokubacteria bacterium]
MRAHGWIGLGLVLAAEAALLSGQPLVARWFTPLVWTGYVLLVDALAARLTGRSYLTTDRVEGVLVGLASVGCWWLFEWYNAPRFWRGGADAAGLWWRYQGLEPNLFLRRLGYDWSFATIFPALFLTATVLRARVFRRVRVRPWRPPRATLRALVVVGAVAAVLPLVVVSAWLVPLVWAAFTLLLEPLNARAGRPSWLADLGRGDASRLAALLAAGVVCGALWEFWNYWAATKWTYSVPYLGHVKVLEMPVLGYLGFPAFALECFAMYQWLRGRLGAVPPPPLP